MVWVVCHFEILIISMSKNTVLLPSPFSFLPLLHHHLFKFSLIFLPSVALDIVFLTGCGFPVSLSSFQSSFISLSFSIMFHFPSWLIILAFFVMEAHVVCLWEYLCLLGISMRHLDPVFFIYHLWINRSDS